MAYYSTASFVGSSVSAEGSSLTAEGSCTTGSAAGKTNGPFWPHAPRAATRVRPNRIANAFFIMRLYKGYKQAAVYGKGGGGYSFGSIDPVSDR